MITSNATEKGDYWMLSGKKGKGEVVRSRMGSLYSWRRGRGTDLEIFSFNGRNVTCGGGRKREGRQITGPSREINKERWVPT